MYVDVGAAEDFPEGEPRVVQLAGREVGIARWRGEVFALRNICPHQYGPVCGGYAMPMLLGDVNGVLEVDDDKLVIVCPWHGWEFDARTGRAAWGQSAYRLKTFPAKIETGRVLVDAGAPPATRAAEPVAGAAE
jgi:nitrite reductase/ring-hydroxylating ferredoxin subunit